MATSNAVPRLTVIVPVRNGVATIARCLNALLPARRDLFELLVVDDRSTDGTAEAARALGVTVLLNDRGSGPAAARNAGAAHARADLLLFVDADIEVRPTTIERVVARFDADPSIAAVFGSYDDEPDAANFVSQYRNLLHHFIHQTAERRSASFWAGCGAIRRPVFLAMGGFDERYERPAIEDIELGLRLRKAGWDIELDAELQVKHLKRWTAYSMMKADIVDRAYPWSKVLLAHGTVPNDLNLRWQHRVSSGLVGLLCATLTFLLLGHQSFYGIPAKPAAGLLAIALLAQLMPLNRGFYGFLIRRRGWRFAARAVPAHFLYYLYSGVTYVACWTGHHVRRAFLLSRRRASATGPSPDR